MKKSTRVSMCGRLFALFLLALCADGVVSAQGAPTSDEPIGPRKASPQPEKSAAIVVGNLGQTVRATYVYASPNTHSPRIFHLKRWEFLAINPASDPKFKKVLLVNNKSGYVLSKDLDVTAFKVRGPKRDVPNDSADPTQFVYWPYVPHGKNPQLGFGNGEFVQFIESNMGTSIPAAPSKQLTLGSPISRLENLQRGDRLYFHSGLSRDVTLAGIYAGNGYFVMSSPRDHIVESIYLGRQWRKLLMAARRDKVKRSQPVEPRDERHAKPTSPKQSKAAPATGKAL